MNVEDGTEATADCWPEFVHFSGAQESIPPAYVAWRNRISVTREVAEWFTISSEAMH